ncbi:TcpQ domain-containing protein [Burkholderia gladioli]|uniref:TcpQ domain-containing protein n=1 Tax=Burkholderia gladioli TaxID=28095 RepID=UPI001C5D3608|nr:TcpQ domain-containing protein [Burkholderia gladioli]MBW5286706.1 toxin co-regulated pilus biosynthesis Q family protein [Burkholderia gladioli]
MSDIMMLKPLPQPMREIRWTRAAIAGLACLVMGSASAAPASAPVEQFQADSSNGFAEAGWQAVDASPTSTASEAHPVPSSRPPTSPTPAPAGADISASALAARTSAQPNAVSVLPSASSGSLPPLLPAKPASDPGDDRPTPTVASVELPYHLDAGLPIDEQLRGWARRAGWTLLWNIEPGWIVPGAQDFGTDFRSAMNQVIASLADNGADVLGDGYEANHVFIVHAKGTN